MGVFSATIEVLEVLGTEKQGKIVICGEGSSESETTRS